MSTETLEYCTDKEAAAVVDDEVTAVRADVGEVEQLGEGVAPKGEDGGGCAGVVVFDEVVGCWCERGDGH